MHRERVRELVDVCDKRQVVAGVPVERVDNHVKLDCLQQGVDDRNDLRGGTERPVREGYRTRLSSPGVFFYVGAS